MPAVRQSRAHISHTRLLEPRNLLEVWNDATDLKSQLPVLWELPSWGASERKTSLGAVLERRKRPIRILLAHPSTLRAARPGERFLESVGGPRLTPDSARRRGLRNIVQGLRRLAQQCEHVQVIRDQHATIPAVILYLTSEEMTV